MKDNPKKGDLRIWRWSQMPAPIGRKHFEVDITTPQEGALMLNLLAEYDLYQLSHGIKPDFSNAGGLVEWDGEDWMDYDDDEYDGMVEKLGIADRFDLAENRQPVKGDDDKTGVPTQAGFVSELHREPRCTVKIKAGVAGGWGESVTVTADGTPEEVAAVALQTLHARRKQSDEEDRVQERLENQRRQLMTELMKKKETTPYAEGDEGEQR